MTDDLRQGATRVVHELLDLVEKLGDDWLARNHEVCRNEAWELLKRARRTTCSGTAAHLGLEAAAMLLLAATAHEMLLARNQAVTSAFCRDRRDSMEKGARRADARFSLNPSPLAGEGQGEGE